MDHESYVNLETAKLLKEAGFDWEVKSYRKGLNGIFETTSIPNNFNDGTLTDWISSPTLDVAQKWLREVKGIFVCVVPEIKDYHTTWIFYICNEQEFLYEYEDCFLTYEEALESGEKKALEIILEKGE